MKMFLVLGCVLALAISCSVVKGADPTPKELEDRIAQLEQRQFTLEKKVDSQTAKLDAILAAVQKPTTPPVIGPTPTTAPAVVSATNGIQYMLVPVGASAGACGQQQMIMSFGTGATGDCGTQAMSASAAGACGTQSSMSAGGQSRGVFRGGLFQRLRARRGAGGCG